MTDSRSVNLAHWDERAPAHAASPDYGFDMFASDPQHLSDVVRFDLPRLGDIAGLTGLHLQCHIGTDTLSLSRLGARMTGLDFSPASIDQARALATRVGADIDYVVADAYDAVNALGEGTFDFVFTGIGALCWLPDIDRWAKVVRGLLRPGGRLFVREGHPLLWSLDYEREDTELVMRYAYFETVDPIVDTTEGSYVEIEGALTHTESHSWNHGLGEIITALLNAGMTITGFEEHESVPWNPFVSADVFRAVEGGEWRLADESARVPLTYTIQAVAS